MKEKETKSIIGVGPAVKGGDYSIGIDFFGNLVRLKDGKYTITSRPDRNTIIKDITT